MIRISAGVTREGFLTSRDAQYMLTMPLMLLGENAARVSDAFISGDPEVPWHQIVGLRNLIAHNYTNLTLDKIWDEAVQMDVSALQALLDEVPGS
ncbi:MAG: DUF86 domain-containing protein [Chloroflexi bacterium]|nr:DUF86 domain-containing protein [Chloroflexota bacterium]